MTENINKLEKILERFKFKQPVPQDIQRQILSFKKETTVSVLKNFGEYNIFYGMVLRFYFLTKRTGINLTARQSGIFISTAAAVLALAGALIIAGFITYRANSATVNEHILFREIERSVERPVEKALKEEIKTGIAIRVRLGITQILSDRENEEFASVITNRLYNRLKDEKSEDTVVFRKINGIDRSFNRLLTGRLNRIGSTYLLSISIANIETGKLLYDKKYSFKEAGEADKIIRMAVENISNKKEIW